MTKDKFIANLVPRIHCAFSRRLVTSAASPYTWRKAPSYRYVHNRRRLHLFLSSTIINLKGGNTFSHVMVGTNDLSRTKTFFNMLLGTLEVRPARAEGHRIIHITRDGLGVRTDRWRADGG